MSFANSLVSLHPEPIPGYKFKVYLQGLCMGFLRISNLENTIETEPLQEGGVNDRVYSLVKPVSTERTLVLERGVAGQGVTALLMMAQLAVGQRLLADIVITVHDRDGNIGQIFLVHGAVTKRISFEAIDAMSGQTLIQRFELAYETLENYPGLGVPDVFT